MREQEERLGPFGDSHVLGWPQGVAIVKQRRTSCAHQLHNLFNTVII